MKDTYKKELLDSINATIEAYQELKVRLLEIVSKLESEE